MQPDADGYTRSPTSFKPGTWCKYGHYIATDSDISWLRRSIDKRIYARCRTCANLSSAKSKAVRRSKPPAVKIQTPDGVFLQYRLSCSHQVRYRALAYAPPHFGDIVYCARCQDYSGIAPLSGNEEQENHEPDQKPGRGEDGVERQPLLEPEFSREREGLVDPRPSGMPGCSY